MNLKKCFLIVAFLAAYGIFISCEKDEIEIFNIAEFYNFSDPNEGFCGTVIQNQETKEIVVLINAPTDIKFNIVKYWVKLKYLKENISCKAADSRVDPEPGHVWENTTFRQAELLEYHEIE